MHLQHKIANRFRLILWGRMFQVFREYILLINSSQLITLGLNNGLIVFENRIHNQFIVKHPSMPLVFESPVSYLANKVGRFVVTPEASFEDEKLLGDRHIGMVCNYSKWVDGQITTSRKKRLPDFADSEEELENNYVL